MELMQEVFAAVEGGPGGVVHLILHFVAGDVGIGDGAEERGDIGLHFGWADIGMCMSAGGADGEAAEAPGVGGDPGEGEDGDADQGAGERKKNGWADVFGVAVEPTSKENGEGKMDEDEG